MRGYHEKIYLKKLDKNRNARNNIEYESENDMSFREVLKKLRGEMKVRDLAKKSGVSVSYLSMLENGRLTNTPKQETIRKIEIGLGVREGTLSIHAPTGSTTTLHKICSVPEDAVRINEVLAAVEKDRKLLDKLVSIVRK